MLLYCIAYNTYKIITSYPVKIEIYVKLNNTSNLFTYIIIYL